MKKFLLFIFAFNLILSFGCDNQIICAEKYYCETYFYDSGTTYVQEEETIIFDQYVMNETNITNGIPNYENYTQANSCAPMAGTIVLGYYDFYFPNLIPNFTSGYIYNKKFYYRTQNSAVNSLKENLYTLMDTNLINPGTSVNQFKNGLSKYVTSYGYNISYSNCGNHVNIKNALSYINNNIPIVLFLDSYIYTPFSGYTIDSNSMFLVKRVSQNGHVVVVQGYREYLFYQSNNLFRTDKYFIVSFGNGTQGLLNINNVNSIDTSLAISIS